MQQGNRWRKSRRFPCFFMENDLPETMEMFENRTLFLKTQYKERKYRFINLTIKLSDNIRKISCLQMGKIGV